MGNVGLLNASAQECSECESTHTRTLKHAHGTDTQTHSLPWTVTWAVGMVDIFFSSTFTLRARRCRKENILASVYSHILLSSNTPQNALLPLHYPKHCSMLGFFMYHIVLQRWNDTKFFVFQWAHSLARWWNGDKGTFEWRDPAVSHTLEAEKQICATPHQERAIHLTTWDQNNNTLPFYFAFCLTVVSKIPRGAVSPFPLKARWRDAGNALGMLSKKKWEREGGGVSGGGGACAASRLDGSRYFCQTPFKAISRPR